MKNQTAASAPSTFQELTNFLTVLNGNKYSDKPLLKKAGTPSRLVYHLEKQFLKEHTHFFPAGQTSLVFSN